MTNTNAPTSSNPGTQANNPSNKPGSNQPGYSGSSPNRPTVDMSTASSSRSGTSGSSGPRNVGGGNGATQQVQPITTRSGSRTARPSSTNAGAPDVQALRDCGNTCNDTIAYCIQEGGKHVVASHITSLQESADICFTTANFWARESKYAADLKRICADVVKAAEESCEEFGDDDATMKACADACRAAYKSLTGHATIAGGPGEEEE
jgi:hypothetical protein